VGSRFESTPSKKIPDNDNKGIKDAINVTAAGTVQAITVAVEIRHTWIGDLRITLTAPDGTPVVLHDRSGASQKDLVRSYDMASSTVLLPLKGKTIAGKWTLQVQDTAALDSGKLEKWSLDFAAAVAPLVAEDVAALLIPDNDPQGVERQIQLPAGRSIGDISVGVDITHPWVGDLRVTLMPPNGPAIILHDRSGGSADNLIRNWRSADIAALGSLHGKDAGGAWKLKVADTASRDEGKLNRWRIEIS
jgi:subtilisin-like proprotein convertase family protein